MVQHKCSTLCGGLPEPKGLWGYFTSRERHLVLQCQLALLTCPEVYKACIIWAFLRLSWLSIVFIAVTYIFWSLSFIHCCCCDCKDHMTQLDFLWQYSAAPGTSAGLPHLSALLLMQQVASMVSTSCWFPRFKGEIKALPLLLEDVPNHMEGLSFLLLLLKRKKAERLWEPSASN